MSFFLLFYNLKNYFKKLNRENGITVIVNIHDVETALEYSDRILGIKKGQLAFDGKPSEVNVDVIRNIYGQDPKNIVVE